VGPVDEPWAGSSGRCSRGARERLVEGDTSEESERQREVSGCGVGGAEKMLGLDGMGKAGVPLAADVTVGLAVVALSCLTEARGAPAYCTHTNKASGSVQAEKKDGGHCCGNNERSLKGGVNLKEPHLQGSSDSRSGTGVLSGMQRSW
jgi:hypothetical protein